MKIKVINPNTTLTMTATIREAAEAVAAPGTIIEAVSPTMGPVSIEGHYDDAMAAIGVCDEVMKGEKTGCDAYVLACFGDPGLHAAREVATGPVIGIAEAAMHAATMLASGFSVINTLQRSAAITEHLAHAYGFHHKLKSIRSTNMAVLELEDPANNPSERIMEQGRLAVEEDGATALLLGCAGMADLAEEMTQAFGIPVIDGVAAGVKMAEALVGLGFKTSKAGDYAMPRSKAYTGELARFGA